MNHIVQKDVIVLIYVYSNKIINKRINMTTKEIAQEIANKVNMPYIWEDILIRLNSQLPLPFKLGND